MIEAVLVVAFLVQMFVFGRERNRLLAENLRLSRLATAETPAERIAARLPEREAVQKATKPHYKVVGT